LPRVELMEKTRSRLEAPRAAIERGRSHPLLAIAAIMGALLLVAWIAWAIYVTDDNGANAGLGVVVGWPALLAALAVIASPFVGLYLLVRLLRPADEADQSTSISEDGSEAAEAETEEKPSGESEDEASGDEEPEEEGEDEDEPEEEDVEEEEEEPEETDPDEEPPSGEKETSVSG
jgi:outer membrane biosynthesis protein TonB